MGSSIGKLVRTGLLLLGMGMVALPAVAQQKSSFKVSGPCVSCGAARIEGLVKGLDGVNAASYNVGTSMLTVDFDPASASLVDMQLELSLQGYDAGDFLRDAKYKLPACAGGGMRGDQAMDDADEPGIDDIEGLEADTDWENPNNIDLGGTASSEDFDLIDEEEEDDSDLANWADENADFELDDTDDSDDDNN